MKRKIIIAVAILLVLGTGTGCAKQKPADTQSTDKTPQTQNSPTGKITPPGTTTTSPGTATAPAGITIQADLTTKLKSEKGVMTGQIYETNNMVLGAMTMEKATTSEAAKALAQKYLELIKAQYPGKRINVQAVSEGKNLANVEYTP